MLQGTNLLNHKHAKLTLSFFLFAVVLFGILLWSAIAVVPLEFPANNTNASAYFGIGPNGDSPSMRFFNATNSLFQCNVSVVNGSTDANITRVVLFINQTTSQLDNNSATINLTHTINSTFVSATINFTITSIFNDGQYAWMCQQEDNNTEKIINQSGTNFFTIDTTAPTLVADTLSNNSVTGDSYQTGQTIVLGINVTDMLTQPNAVRLFVNVSGQTSNEVNITRNVLNNTAANFSYFISFASSQVLNFTFEINDTLNNRRNLSTSLIFSILNTIPDANTSFNETSPSIGTVYNFSGNVTDDVALHTAQWITNVSGSYEFLNHTLSGTSAQVSNTTTFTRGGVFNFTLRVNDTVGNIWNNITIIFVADNVAPVVNTTFNTLPLTNALVANYTANVTDETALSNATWSHNATGSYVYVNYTLLGTSAQVSNTTSLSGLVGGTVINFSIVVRDTTGNERTNDTIITVTDATAPTVNTTFNASTFRNIDVVNYTANITDETQLSGAQWITNITGVTVYTNTTISGASAQVSNAVSLAGLPGGYVINFTITANDTSNNRKQNSTLITLTDAISPIVNTSFNSTFPNIVIGTVFNFTANVTDETGLLSANWTYNLSGSLTIINYTLTGISAEVSNSTVFTQGGVFNFTLYVTDTSNNVKQNSTLIIVTDNVVPVVNTSFNISTITTGHLLNFTANVTDETSLASVTITNNMSGTLDTSTQTLSGISATVSNLTLITAVGGAIINFSMTVTDVTGNSYQNSTLFIVSDLVLPVVNTTFNTTTFRNIDMVNYTANITDETGLLVAEWITNITGVSVATPSVIGGTSAQVSGTASLAGLPGGYVINFTIRVNDTSNNVGQNSTVITVTDAFAPIVNTSFNHSSPTIGTTLGYSGNSTDETLLSLAQWINNVSGYNEFYNYTLSWQTYTASNSTTFTRGGVFNFTLRVNDTSNNFRQNSTIITVTDNVAPVVNTTFNLTAINNGNLLNFTANITDETSLQSVNISNNMSGTTVYSVVSLSGTSAQVSNLTAISVSSGAVINFSMAVLDSFGNMRTNSTIITITDTIAPTITTNLPVQAAPTHGVATFAFNISVSSDTSTCKYVINKTGSTANVSMTLASSVCTGSALDFNNTQYNITFFATDASNNVGQLVYFLNMSDNTLPTTPNTNTSTVSTSSTTRNATTITISNINETVNATVLYGTSVGSLSSSATSATFGQTKTISLTGLTDDTTYYYNVSVCDYVGNCAKNGTFSFTTDEIPVASSSSSSSSSGGGGGAVITPVTNTQASISKVWSEVLADTPVTMYINNEQVAVSAIILSSGDALSQAELSVSSLKAKPSTISSTPSTSVYQYLEFTPKNLGTKLQNIVIEFDVPTTWLTTNGINRDTVVLYRYASGQWNALPTSVANVKTGEIEYSATTPGFSTFAIGSSASSPSTDSSNATASEPEPVTTTGETELATEGQAETLEPYAGEEPQSALTTKKIMPYVAVGLVIFLIIVVVVINQRNKGKEDKDFSF